MGWFSKKPDPKKLGWEKEMKRQKHRRKQIDKWERQQDKPRHKNRWW